MHRDLPLDKERRSPMAGAQETRLACVFTGRAPSSRAAHSAPLDWCVRRATGYPMPMVHLQEKAKDIVHSVEHPVEAAKALEREAELGKSARTPLIALTGVTLLVFVLLALMLAVTMTLYFVYGGH
jgi:hypothetical protein